MARTAQIDAAGMAAIRKASAILLTAFALALALPGAAQALTVAPDTFADDYGGVSACSLREAIQSTVNGSAFGGCATSGTAFTDDTIQLAPGRYEIEIPSTGTSLDNSESDLNFQQALRIEATGAGDAVIDGNSLDRVLFYGGALTLEGVSVTGANVDTAGAVDNFGGGISGLGGSSLTMSDGAVFGNSADGTGGGISVVGPIQLTNVTVSGNTSTNSGGAGIEINSGLQASTLEHVTVSNNTSQNTSGVMGSAVAGGILFNGSTTNLHNTIVAGNFDSSPLDAPDCQGAGGVASMGGNVVGDATGCDYTAAPSDATGVDARLAAFDTASLTHAPFADSPAVARATSPCAALDQRGVARPQPAGTACDSGAFESSFPLPPGDPGAGPGPAVTPAKGKKCKRPKKRAAAASAKKKKKRCKKKKRRG